MKLSQENIKRFQKKVLSFYHRNKRELPWRNTTDPYRILLSEFMLQQTQVSRVITYYEKWITRWPTIQHLAAASQTDVLQTWMGLGYNTRARYLHQAAKKIVIDYNGDVLEAMKHYTNIPGVGKYTAQAVQIFATNADLVTVDTNIRRIIISEFYLPQNTSEKDLWDCAMQCLPYGKSKEWHNALMDYGALHLTSQKTGIKPTTHQSRFKGSDRQIRAQILRHLLKKNASLAELQATFSVDRIRVKTILEKMKNQHLIIKKNKIYQVKND